MLICACDSGVDRPTVEKIAEERVAAALARKATTDSPPAIAAPPDPISAGAFELRDPQGRVRARLHLDETGAPRLSLLDPEGRDRARLQVDNAGDAQLLLMNHKGRKRIALRVEDAIGPTLSMSDAGGAQVIRLEAPDKGDLGLSMQRGRATLYAGVSRAGVASFGMSPSDVPSRSGLSMPPEGGARLQLVGADGSVVWTAPAGRAAPKVAGQAAWALVEPALTAKAVGDRVSLVITGSVRNGTDQKGLPRVCAALLDAAGARVSQASTRLQVDARSRGSATVRTSISASVWARTRTVRVTLQRGACNEADAKSLSPAIIMSAKAN